MAEVSGRGESRSTECGEPVPDEMRAPWSKGDPLLCEREPDHPPDTHCVYGNAGFPLFQWPVSVDA